MSARSDFWYFAEAAHVARDQIETLALNSFNREHLSMTTAPPAGQDWRLQADRLVLCHAHICAPNLSTRQEDPPSPGGTGVTQKLESYWFNDGCEQRALDR